MSKKSAWIIGGTVVAILIVTSVVPSVLGLIYGGQYGGWGMMGPGMMGGFGTMGIMSVVWIVVIGLIVWAVVVSTRGAWGSGGSGPAPESSALEVLKKRYARGEMSKAEYEEMKKDIA